MQSNMAKLVTIVVPIYKRLEYLPNVLAVVSAQDYPNIELIVSDNGMNGNRVPEIVEAHYSRPYRFRQNPATVASPQHYNQLLAEATGEFFVLLCDDDEISPNYVSELARSLERHPEASVAISRQEMIAKDGSVIRTSSEIMPSVLSGEEFIAATWHDYAFGMEMVATSLIRTEKLRACGGYPDFCRGTGIDNAVIVKIGLNSSIALNAKCTFRWRLDDASFGWSVSMNELALASREFLRFLDADQIIREYAKAFPAQWQLIKSYLVKMTWETYLGRWNTIYRERLSWLSWVRSAFLMPLIAPYYRNVASVLVNEMKAFVKARLKVGHRNSGDRSDTSTT